MNETHKNIENNVALTYIEPRHKHERRRERSARTNMFQTRVADDRREGVHRYMF